MCTKINIFYQIGFCSEIGPSKNWHYAQMLCKNNKTVLTNVLYNASLADGYYWTGYHVRMSQWIKIIGKCYISKSKYFGIRFITTD